MAVNLSMLAGAGAQFFTDSGIPLNGGLIYTYAAGTTTPQATYTSSSGGTAHSNPIVLNSAGRVASGGEIWLTDAVSYKFVLQTSAAVTIATYDNVTGNSSGIYAAFAASTGSSLVGFIQSGTGAVATTVQAKLRENVSVKDFGAVGNGTTNDTTAFQAAIDSITTTGTIFIPAGTYKLTSSLTVDISKVQLVGEYATLSWATAASNVVAIEVTSNAALGFTQPPGGISGVSLVGPGGATTSVGINFNDAGSDQVSYASFDKIAITNFYNGCTFRNNTYLISFYDCNIRVDNSCLSDFTGLSNAGERMAFVNCTFSGASYALNCLNPSSDWDFVNCSFDCAVYEIYVVGGATISCTNCHFEYLGSALYSQTNGSSNPYITFTSCNFIQVTSSANPNFNVIKGNVTFVGGRITVPAAQVTNIYCSATGTSLTVLNTAINNPGSAVDSLNGSPAVYLPASSGFGVRPQIKLGTDVNGVISKSFVATVATGSSVTTTVQGITYGVTMVAIGGIIDSVGPARGLYLCTGSNSVVAVYAMAAGFAVTSNSTTGVITLTNTSGNNFTGVGFVTSAA